MLEFGIKYLRLYVILHIYTLSVQGLSVTQSPEKVMYGSPVTITCNIGKITQEVEWLYEGIQYFKCSKPYCAGICHKIQTIDQTHYSYDFNIEKGTTQVQLQSVIKKKNEGNWTCKHGGSVVGDIAINVTDKPLVTFTGFIDSVKYSTSINVDEGGEVELKCESTEPVQKITISGSDRESSSNESASNHSWPIKARCFDHEFRCEASNGYGSANPEMLTLNVKCPVKLKDDTETTVVTNVGSDTTLVVRFVGYPKPQIVWSRKIGHTTFVSMTNYRNTKTTSHNNATLTIQTVHMEDSGVYKADLSTGGRSLQKDFTLVVNEKTTSVTNDCGCGSIGIGVGVGIAVTLVLVAVVLSVTWGVLRWRKSKGPVNIVVGQEEYENVQYTKEKS
ncbi:uncharacterized protein LOC126825072 [Patella vulgata]|uniref:uncharacterized protein LOC126825072 n=1 Tax=Patella vulgata TaxID=6465 RepID=UPI0024A9ECB1|nr:uncharacterized protein LOC126825072 [Patella vulgata]XP_055957573.1 uncharacterized protein LOC126825072 [Patella vulgata]